MQAAAVQQLHYAAGLSLAPCQLRPACAARHAHMISHEGL